MKEGNTKQITKTSNLSLFEFGCFILLAYLIFIRFIQVFTFNTNLEGVEFALVHFVQLICLKGHLYGEVSHFPYLLIVHAPLYYYLMAGIMQLLHIDVIKDVHAMFFIGRSISFGLLFASYFVLLKLVLLINKEFKYKLILGLLFMLFIPPHFYAFRPDSFKVFFFIVFLYFFVKAYQTEKKLFHLFAGLSLLISILFKQDVLVYGCLFYAIFFLRSKKLVYFLIPTILVSIIFVNIYIYYLATGINLFKELFLYNIQYDSDITINLLLITSHYIKVIPLFIFTILNLKSKNQLSVSLALVSIFYLLVCTLFMLRIGSSFNYTYESVLLLLVNVVIYITENKLNVNRLILFTYLFILFSINQLIFYRTYLHTKDELVYKNFYFSNQLTSKKIKRIIGNEVVFIPDMKYYIYYPECNIIYGSDWHYDRYCDIALNIKIHPKFINNSIVKIYDEQFENGKVKYILIENNSKSKNLLQKYYNSFHFKQQVDNLLIYQFYSTK